jgi:antitoxin VapB
MDREFRARIFKSGNSVALRLPKALGLAEGTEVVVREERGGYSFTPIEPQPTRIDLAGIYGSIPGLEPLTAEDRRLEAREPDWEGKRLEGKRLARD